MIRARPYLGLSLFFGLAAALVARPAAADLFSPGDLAKPHSDLEGLSNCTKCHEAGKQLSQGACLECHTELKQRVEAGQGYHGRIKSEKRECETCHHDHQGRPFEMIEWKNGPKGFDHRESGWLLSGAHKKTECAKCHESRLITDERVRKWLGAHPAQKTTWLGAPQACVSCHFDDHRGQESTKCETCHDEAAWKPAPRFDHEKTKYALEGKHRKVECVKCHPVQEDTKTAAGVFPAPKAAKFAKYKDLPFARCDDCHKDPHKGSFGASCSGCHTLEDWKQIKGSAADRVFHEKSRYPLRGAHMTVACAACHPGTPMKTKPLPFAHCTDCHADGHEGQLQSKEGVLTPCEECHGVEAFKPARYTVEDHAKTEYALEGKHEKVECDLCHYDDRRLATEASAAVRSAQRKAHRKELVSAMALLLPPETKGSCLGCHPDGHEGQLMKKSQVEKCEDCHTVASFSPSSYELEQHAKSRYPLEGAHRAVGCGLCHKDSPELRKQVPPAMKAMMKRGGQLLSSAQVIRPPGQEKGCIGCHDDVHAGQFKARVAKGGCEACHVDASFSDLKKFDHDRDSKYKLTGKHAKAPCATCHLPEDLDGHQVVRYRPVEKRCEGCHEDVHFGQLVDKKGVNDCGRCHTTKNFHDTTFEHEEPFTTYVLDGRHANVKCAACHTKVAIEPKVQTVRYKPLPRACEFCHADEHRRSLAGVHP